jgi:hypothetical protein
LASRCRPQIACSSHGDPKIQHLERLSVPIPDQNRVDFQAYGLFAEMKILNCLQSHEESTAPLGYLDLNKDPSFNEFSTRKSSRHLPEFQNQ